MYQELDFSAHNRKSDHSRALSKGFPFLQGQKTPATQHPEPATQAIEEEEGIMDFCELPNYARCTGRYHIKSTKSKAKKGKKLNPSAPAATSYTSKKQAL